MGPILLFIMCLKAEIGGKDKYLHVTTGVGSMDYPMRWGTDSELVVLKLRKKN